MVQNTKDRNEEELPIVMEGTSNDDLIEEIKIEAHQRRINKMKDMQATEEDLNSPFSFLHTLQMLSSLFNERVSHPIVDNRYIVTYNNYCKVRESELCPVQLRDFLSDRLFETLRADQRDYMGRVDVKRVLMYCHKRLLVNHNLLLLSSYSRAGLPFVTYDEFQDFLTLEIVPSIPGLQESNRVLDPTYYTYFVEKKVHFLLDPLHTQKIRIIDLLATGVMDSLIDQYEGEKATDKDNKYSIFSCESLLALFRSLDKDGNGLLSCKELSQYNECKYSLLFIKNVFLTEKTFTDEVLEVLDDGEEILLKEPHIDFTGFLNFYNAVEDKKLIQSMRWMFRVLDEDSKGYFTREEIKDHAKSLMEIVEERTYQMEAKVDDLVDEVFDMCRPIDPTRITLKDVIECGKGATVLGIITNLDDYIAYETREDPQSDPDQ
ncbi:hypothetical protein PMAYCL1PPCAC_02475 [Pristionchus mayeri]|uniref:EF-hand domain-containing protein n=1 Tax=Pristionchus mayeri TaxID=1317129 RepID=A0AAN4Z871_9BILA|nr:hypothetical protein PMAYCL1PPCAC_02475 [Pristionchus mayeri]